METSYKFTDFGYNVNGKERILSGIDQLDYLLKGFEMGCMTIWTGVTNMGKSTVLTKIAKETLKQGNKVFFFNGEQTKDDFKNNIYKQMVTKEDIYRVQYKNTNIYDYYVKDEMAKYLSAVYDSQITVFNNDSDKRIVTILQAMEKAFKEGTRVFIIDNFMQIDIASADVFMEQSKIAESLRKFAVSHNVHIHLVAHPRKIENRQLRLSLYDISGSMNLVNKAYNVISIIRRDRLDEDSIEYGQLKKYMQDNRYRIEESDTILEVLKEKGNGCGVIGLKFDKDTKDFTEQERFNQSLLDSIIENRRLEKEAKEYEREEKIRKKMEKLNLRGEI